MNKPTVFLLLLVSIGLAGCAGLRPYHTAPVQVRFRTHTGQALRELPAPEQKIVAAVYGFRDQTGQYQPAKGISYSTAVTQGATSILIEALETSGWFIPIARASISNLLNERRIIRSTRQQNSDPTTLQPLLFAGILLEGGIISYSSNVVTGGAGVRFLGMGTSGQFRKDKVTIYLRAISTQTGRILKSVRTSKAIISQQLQAGVFRYVAANRLLEAEVGITYNEPAVTAVTAAINAALRKLILQGVKEGLWQAARPPAIAAYKAAHRFGPALQDSASWRDVYGLVHRPALRGGVSLTTSFTYGSHLGNYPHEIASTGLMVQLEAFLTPTISLRAGYQRSVIGARHAFQYPINNFDLMVNAYLTPDFRLSPYVAAGGGIAVLGDVPAGRRAIYPALAAAAGLSYRLSETIGLRVGVNYRYYLGGEIDGITAGSISDQQWSIVTGITFF